MNNIINNEQHNDLKNILISLLDIIELMEKETNDYLLKQNGSEATDWLKFLNEHTDKEELKSLENEIANRLFYKFDVEIIESELDDKRVQLMKDYILKSNHYTK